MVLGSHLSLHLLSGVIPVTASLRCSILATDIQRTHGYTIHPLASYAAKCLSLLFANDVQVQLTIRDHESHETREHTS